MVDAKRLAPEKQHHIQAFSLCVASADMYLRKHCAANEVAAVVAEDDTEMRRFLREAGETWKKHSLVLDGESLNPTTEEKKTGLKLQDGTLKIERVVDRVHFAEKEHAPLLQLADACAFTVQRYFSKKSFGYALMTAMLGHPMKSPEDWDGPSTFITYRWHP